MQPGQSYVDPYSCALKYESQLQEVPKVQQVVPNQFFSPCQPTLSSADVSRDVKCTIFPNGVTYGNGTNGALANGVVPVQVDPTSRFGKCEVKKVKPVREQRVFKPMKLPEGVLKSSPFPPDLELPAILGGKLPPPTIRTKSKKHVYTERELKSRRKKGLPDDSDSESEERRQVRLPRRSLLTITTSQMSQFVNFLRLNLELTPSQQDELSKQKRLVKNRESACRFRAKKVLSIIEYRERVMELETDLVKLREENERLRKALMEATAGSSTTSSAPSQPAYQSP